MDRSLSKIQDDGAGQDGPILPSRASALATGLNALKQGIVLISGEPGAGKSWLGERLRSAFPSNWIEIEVFPSMTSEAFYSAMGQSLSIGSHPSRNEVLECLAEQSIEGRCTSLVVEECHLSSAEILEEIRLLSNRQGRSGGLAAILLIGQTRLTLRMDSRSLRALESRVSARVHLRHLDADEAWSLTMPGDSSAQINRTHFEAIHRASAGNPRRLQQLTRIAFPAGDIPEPAKEIPTPPKSISRPLAMPEPIVVGAAKPPLRMEDGLIEVGYDSNFDPEDAMPVGPRPPSANGDADEEPIVDHYAALQAWDEWARNQGREAVDVPAPVAGDIDDADEVETKEPTRSWGEEAQAFTPYSQLFSRLKSVREAD